VTGSKAGASGRADAVQADAVQADAVQANSLHSVPTRDASLSGPIRNSFGG